MNERRNRQLSGVVGVFLLVVAGAVLALLGADALAAPVILTQATLLGLAGIVDVVAATDTLLTDRWGWYRWSGLGNVLLGCSLPLGFVDASIGGEPFFFLLTAAGGLSLAAMGLDMLVFHGKYTRGERLDRR